MRSYHMTLQQCLYLRSLFVQQPCPSGSPVARLFKELKQKKYTFLSCIYAKMQRQQLWKVGRAAGVLWQFMPMFKHGKHLPGAALGSFIYLIIIQYLFQLLVDFIYFFWNPQGYFDCLFSTVNQLLYSLYDVFLWHFNGKHGVKVYDTDQLSALFKAQTIQWKYTCD